MGEKQSLYEQIKRKIITVSEIEPILSARSKNHSTLVFTNGCFDLLHKGHLHYLTRARELGDHLIIGLNSDDSVRRLKGPGRPILSEETRAEILASLFFVDHVILFHEDTPINLIMAIQPDVLVKGGDYKAEEIAGYREVTSGGGLVEIVPYLEGYSSSGIISKLR